MNYPKKIKKRKRTYREAFGDDNEIHAGLLDHRIISLIHYRFEHLSFICLFFFYVSTDNICESFYNRLNNLIENPHPKIVFELKKLKYMIDNLLLNKDNSLLSFNIYIMTFLNLLQNWKKNKVSFKLIKKLEEYEEKNLKNLSLKFNGK